MPESDSWKAVAYDQMMEQLQDSEVGAAKDWILGANSKILVFKDNEHAEKFEILMSIKAGS